MPDWVGGALDWLVAAPEAVFLIVLGLAAGIENVIPPVPADVVVLGGSFLAIRAGANLGLLFLVVWVGNVGGALLVYLLGRRYGVGFFQGRLGSFLLRPSQLATLERLYLRYGFPIIFLSRFLPMFRAVVPVFAGVARVGFVRTAVPIATASGLWYGALVYAGATAGRHWDVVVAKLESASQGLWLVAIVATVGVAWWWWRSR